MKDKTPYIPDRVVRIILYLAAAGILLSVLGQGRYARDSANGFSLDNALVPVNEIHHGGPPRDGIPAIDHPEFIDSGQVDFLQEQEWLLAIELEGVRRAYPLRILNYHEIINDVIAGRPVVISYCPLCGTGMAFEASRDGTASQFGVSGLLYNSNILLYDRQTESLWSQLLGQAISGPRRGERLVQIPLEHTTWRQWRSAGGGQVLSLNTGYDRDYSRSPYAGYAENERIYFPVSAVDPRYHPKERVIGLELDGQQKVYPFAELSKTESPLWDRFNNHRIKITFDAEARSGVITDEQGRALPSTSSYWFAWMAFYPQSELFEAQ